MRISLGTAIKLGLEDGGLSFSPKTAYLLIGEGCNYGCKYCDVSHGRLARITWPSFRDDLVLDALNSSDFERVCLQVTGTGMEEALEILERVNLPRSVCARITDLEQVKLSFKRGADTIGLALDGVTPKISDEIGRGGFEETLALLKESAKIFPGRIWTHLIIGLGETERDAVELMQELHAAGVGIALFAFTPVEGTEMENFERPSMNAYRRMQIARYLIENDLQKEFSFNSRDELIGFNDAAREAFLTSGCESCDRGYYDSNPGDPYNFPDIVNDEDYKKAIGQARTWRGSNVYKAGKLIRIFVEYGDYIKDVRITGDFFVHPEESLEGLESSLIGLPVDKNALEDKIKEFMKTAQVFGFDERSLTDAIMGAVV